ncbi:MAG: erythromycin esterase family protein [Gemmatimonadales bacterium]
MLSVATRHSAAADRALSHLIGECCTPFGDIPGADLAPLLDRIGESRVVLIGEASHGTSEFYRMRARITRELITRAGFGIVAAEADWPDAARLDRYARYRAPGPRDEAPAFTRFPTWMWRNEETATFIEWLRARNAGLAPGERTGFYGLDLYSMFTSIAAVLRYLDGTDPEAARIARARYGCLMAWEPDAALYGRAAVSGRFHTCEEPALAMLQDLLRRRLEDAARDGDLLFDAVQNARVVADAESYYRAMYYGSVQSWNLRDSHMFETLEQILAHRGPEARAVVWAHNSHVGDAAATQMGAQGEYNIGQLCRDAFGDAVFIIGFGTDHGTVAAASEWNGRMERMAVRPALPESYEALCHASGIRAFQLPLRHAHRDVLPQELADPRLERAIGVIYRPDTERQSHYFEAVLPGQFDEYVWFDETAAVEPLVTSVTAGMPETWPYGL